MSQINITCIDQTAIFTNTPEIFSGDVNVDTVKFNFDNSWNNYETKTAVFYNNPKETYPVMLDENNVAVIPKEVMARKSKLSIGVFGTNVNGDVKTSKILTYTIGRGAISDDLGTNSSSMDVWVQLLTRQLYFEDEINAKVEIMSDEIDTLSDDVDTVEAIAKGRNQALAYNGYSEMITALNSMSADELNRGQNIYIATLGVPDLWVYDVEETNVEYTYVDDDTFVEGLNVNTTVQAGYYKLAQLETQKVDVGGITNDINTLQEGMEDITPRVETLETTVTNKANVNLGNITNSVFLAKGVSSGLGQIEIKSYVGDGRYTSSASNPQVVSLTFSFAPKIVMWLGTRNSGAVYMNRPKDYANTYNDMIMADLLTTSYTNALGFFLNTSTSSELWNTYGKKSSDGKTISWYVQHNNATNGPIACLNKKDTTYYFLAIG